MIDPIADRLSNVLPAPSRSSPTGDNPAATTELVTLPLMIQRGEHVRDQKHHRCGASSAVPPEVRAGENVGAGEIPGDVERADVLGRQVSGKITAVGEAVKLAMDAAAPTRQDVPNLHRTQVFSGWTRWVSPTAPPMVAEVMLRSRGPDPPLTVSDGPKSPALVIVPIRAVVIASAGRVRPAVDGQ